MDAAELCRVLLVGSVAAADVPELGQPETRDEVRRRLGEAGCELVYSPASERWLARLDGAVPALEGHDPVLALGTAELAVLATCWLHLRFLPEEARSTGAPPRGSPDPSGSTGAPPRGSPDPSGGAAAASTEPEAPPCGSPDPSCTCSSDEARVRRRPLAGDEGSNSTPWALAMIAPIRSALRSRW
jgi:hypothetical protein